jgi:DNA-binding SARP family transcriptional activator
MPGARKLAPDTLQLQLLGAPCWRRAGKEAQPLAARDAALLALLALDGAQPRERIGAWLWPAASPRQLGVSLRQRLFKLRRATGHAVVDSGAMLQLAAGVDVDLLAKPLRADGPLLGGCDLGPLEDFGQWLEAARERISIRQTQAWASEAAQLESRGDWPQAVALCERIVATRPPTEQAWRRLMRLHWLQGDRAAAIAAFERFEHQVCREHGLRPSAETLTLLETVERSEPATSRAADRPGDAGGDALPPSLLHPPHLIGRDALMARAHAAWAAKRPLLLLADGGLGKSRFLEALLDGRPGTLSTRARPGDAAQPYGTVGTWLGLALDRFAPALTTDVRNELARLLPSLGRAPAEAADQRRLWQAVESAVAGCVNQGLEAWALDDLHLADTASLELLCWLLASDRLLGLHGAFAARPPLPSDTLDVEAALRQVQRLELLRLPPLEPKEVQHLLESLALPDWSHAPPSHLQALYRHTGGQPFLLLETLKALVLSGRAPGVGPLPLPPAVDALIGQRLGALPTTARTLLEVLSVAGGTLRLAVAAPVMAQPLPALAAAWSQLAAAQLVQRSGGVAHDLVREAVLRSLPTPTRQAWHLALAQAMKAEDRVEPAAAATHWEAAEHWPEAAAAWRRAAAAASRAGRLVEWESLLLRAAAAHRAAGEVDAALDDTIDALTARSLRSGPASVAPELARLLEEGHPGEPRARLLMLQGTLAFNQMRYADVMRLADGALDQAADGSRTQQQARLLHGRAAAMSGRHAQALVSLEQACDAAQTLGEPDAQLEALGTLAHALHAARRRADAIVRQRQALQLARRHSGRFHQAECAANLAVVLLSAGEVETALAAADEALSGFGVMGIADAPSAVMALSVRSRCWAHQGRLAQAVSAMAPVAAPGSGGLAGVMARTGLAQLHLWLGQPAQALAVLDADDPAAPVHVRAYGALVRVAAGAPGAGDALRTLGDTHPGLRDDALVYRDWCRWDPPAEAAARLDRLADEERAAGAPATARSLGVMAVACRLGVDPMRAAEDAATLVAAADGGLHAGSCPPEAWGTLARALRGHDPAGAAKATARARAWVAAADLPDGVPRATLRRAPPAARSPTPARR